jgi:hypothetical protein
MIRRPSRVAPQSVARIVVVPVVLAAASLAGLVLGLTGEGWRDGLSAILLFLPLAIFARHWLRRG